MKMSQISAALACATGLMLLPALAAASAYEHVREGWTFGVNLGGGGAALEARSVDATETSVASDRLNGIAGDLRFGYAVRPDLILGFEASGWAREVSEPFLTTTVDVTRSVGVAAVALTWFPTQGGFFLRGGVGGGQGRIEVKAANLAYAVEESGPALLAGIGYEWRVTPSLALGPQFGFGWINLEETQAETGAPEAENVDFRVNYANLTFGLNWYW